MKNWNVLNTFENNNLIELLLENRGIKTKKEKEAFLNPQLKTLTAKEVGIDSKQLQIAITRIKKAIKNKEQIVIFGDYDVDGITGSAILWEVLHDLGASVLPYIPHRVGEGYGLSELGIQNAKEKSPELKLIITVDNGIVAHNTTDFANKEGIDVIITDHHVPGDTLPNAHAIVHTTALCGAGVAYVLSQELKLDILGARDNDENDIHLELATLGTIADLVPLTGPNRTIVRHGLLQLGKCKRMGLTELFKLANIMKDMFSVYDVGYIIAPRLNAAGRIESAMDSLRLICTKDNARARHLAQKLEEINTERQRILKSAAEHAKKVVRKRIKMSNLLFVADESYQQGVIGLVAGKLVEEFYRPAIAISIGPEKSKGSARSVAGFNIIEFLRSHKELFLELGGHPMAAGFSVQTKKLKDLQKVLEESADQQITKEMLQRVLKIDCELSLDLINTDMYNELQALAPFGMANPEPTFASTGVEIKDIKLLGREKNHLKMSLLQNGSPAFDAIGFGMGEFADSIKTSTVIDIAYTVDTNTWNGSTKLQLKLKDIKTHD